MKQENVDKWIQKRKERKNRLHSNEIFEKILQGDISALSSGITLIESTNSEDKSVAQELIQKCLPHSGKSIRIGITGVPGVGKSTFIESFGQHLNSIGRKVAVLAIDPTSGISGGSILGDKTRMQNLSMLENVFIRPSAAGDSLGGVARKTRESILLCETAGFDTILIETVGVGQSETIVKSMVDFFLLLMLSGAGDELQGIKKGIMEMADALVITKTDGDNIKKANLAAREYKNALHLFPPNPNNWIPQVFTCSSLTGNNIDKTWKVIESFENQVKLNGWFERNRKEQDKEWLEETLKELILSDFYSQKENMERLKLAKLNVEQGKISSFQAAEDIHKEFRKNERND